MVKNQVGRPPIPGDRYNCGRRKPVTGRSGTAWRRIVDHAIAFGHDPRIASVVSRLGYNGELSTRQVETAFKIAKYYGEYERHKGRRRSTASPSYERAYASDGGEDQLSPEALGKLERRIRVATVRFLYLQEEIDSLPFPPNMIARVRNLLEELCVEDREIDWQHLGVMRALLDRLHARLSRKDPAESILAEGKSIAISARRAPRQPQRRIPADERPIKPDLNKIAFLAVMNGMGQDDETASASWERYVAMRERARFRLQKKDAAA